MGATSVRAETGVAERYKLCHRWGGWREPRGETLTAPAVGSSYWFGMKTVYLAARYSRREELCEYREHLSEMGFLVQARWLDGGHQLADNGIPIGESGEALVEGDASGCSHESQRLREKFAQDDWEDVISADIVISFTEPPRSKANRGGRHVEFGIALARGARVIVVGFRENIFHWLPQVEFVGTIGDALALLEHHPDAPNAEALPPGGKGSK